MKWSINKIWKIVAKKNGVELTTPRRKVGRGELIGIWATTLMVTNWLGVFVRRIFVDGRIDADRFEVAKEGELSVKKVDLFVVEAMDENIEV